VNVSLPFELAVKEDLNIGRGTLQVTMPAGGTATGTRINLGSFVDPGAAFSTFPSASLVPGMLDVVSDSTTKTPGATITGGGTYRVLAFSNGTNWLVVMG
jgi:hypothetical protein